MKHTFITADILFIIVNKFQPCDDIFSYIFIEPNVKSFLNNEILTTSINNKNYNIAKEIGKKIIIDNLNIKKISECYQLYSLLNEKDMSAELLIKCMIGTTGIKNNNDLTEILNKVINLINTGNITNDFINYIWDNSIRSKTPIKYKMIDILLDNKFIPTDYQIQQTTPAFIEMNINTFIKHGYKITNSFFEYMPIIHIHLRKININLDKIILNTIEKSHYPYNLVKSYPRKIKIEELEKICEKGDFSEYKKLVSNGIKPTQLCLQKCLQKCFLNNQSSIIINDIIKKQKLVPDLKSIETFILNNTQSKDIHILMNNIISQNIPIVEKKVNKINRISKKKILKFSQNELNENNKIKEKIKLLLTDVTDKKVLIMLKNEKISYSFIKLRKIIIKYIKNKCQYDKKYILPDTNMKDILDLPDGYIKFQDIDNLVQLCYY
jgi:hypothetical protein